MRSRRKENREAPWRGSREGGAELQLQLLPVEERQKMGSISDGGQEEMPREGASVGLDGEKKWWPAWEVVATGISAWLQ